jgi:hypothetical protein
VCWWRRLRFFPHVSGIGFSEHKGDVKLFAERRLHPRVICQVDQAPCKRVRGGVVAANEVAQQLDVALSVFLSGSMFTGWKLSMGSLTHLTAPEPKATTLITQKSHQNPGA